MTYIDLKAADEIFSSEEEINSGERSKQLNNSQEQPAITAKLQRPLSAKPRISAGEGQFSGCIFFKLTAVSATPLLLATSRETA